MIYGEIDRWNMTQFLGADKIVFDNITVCWCVTCIFNKIMTLHIIWTLELLQRKMLLQREVTLLPNMTKYINS